ncbi:hypothetical protein [Frondihabitans australicus]|uniref:Uncharacterized protein n=1 Tax=Frondihabitans australicus TaxID=386892 RepID=A0A495IFA8_9MICO|nr:hypothetical protein [Frondihabitans australicus]RKR74687.1 hypothetical protein C8E83_1814 [Frondihabitans australicus]
MTSKPAFDDERSAAIRRMLTAQVAAAAPAAPASARPTRRRRPILIATMATAAAVVIAGGVGLAVHGLPGSAPGGDQAPHIAAPSPTATVAPPVTGSPAPEPSSGLPAGESTPTPVPSFSNDPRTWTVGYASFGPVTLGGSPEQTLTGAGFTRMEDGGCGVSYLYGKYDDSVSSDLPYYLQVIVGQTTGVDEFDVHVSYTSDDSASPIPGSPQTAEGIGLGDSQASLLAAYPALQKINDVPTAGDTPGVRTFQSSSVDGGRMTFMLKEYAPSDWRIFTMNITAVDYTGANC